MKQLSVSLKRVVDLLISVLLMHMAILTLVKCVKVSLCDSWGFLVGEVFFEKDNGRLFFLEVF